jgi:16S rRNA (cytosine1402-N4)-methyltransferase
VDRPPGSAATPVGDDEAVPVHVPVMVTEIAAAVVRRSPGVFVDATVNGGGHAEELMKVLPKDNVYIGIDADGGALDRARLRLKKYGSRVLLERTSFVRMAEAAGTYAGEVTNVLFDLGLSSAQLADRERGFSFKAGGPLNMRFDGDDTKLTAAEVVNTFDEERLADVIYEFGEERRSRAVARAIVARRAERPFEDAADLAAVVARAVGGRRGRIHPATRTFQALRIFVNDELASLEKALPAAESLLAAGGRILVISYHSLEDRVTKRYFRAGGSGGLRAVTRKVGRPGPEEVRANPRSRSARLRVAEKV